MADSKDLDSDELLSDEDIWRLSRGSREAKKRTFGGFLGDHEKRKKHEPFAVGLQAVEALGGFGCTFKVNPIDNS
jgi:hypothetical protein